jgi:hypothetical protein
MSQTRATANQRQLVFSSSNAKPPLSFEDWKAIVGLKCPISPQSDKKSEVERLLKLEYQRYLKKHHETAL